MKLKNKIGFRKFKRYYFFIKFLFIINCHLLLVYNYKKISPCN